MTGVPMTYADLAREVRRRPARLGDVRLVAVDGGSGAGKTTFAGRLAVALRATGVHTEIVHTDDLLDGWADQFTFWPRLVTEILRPLAEGRAGSYRRYDWLTGGFAESVTVPVPDVLIVEGVSVARLDVHHRLTLAVFMTADPDLRLDRAVARDGAGIEPDLRVWLAAEEVHFARNTTPERANVLVDGAPRVEHDPSSEFVRLR